MKYPPRLHLAHLPTPIQKLERISARVGKEIYVWRDDLTGFVESGNKVRKLEFLLADALEKGATRIITSGGYQSNHTRATTYAARRLGLEISLVLREPRQGLDHSAVATGNLLLSQIAGAEIHFITFNDYQAAGATYLPILEKLASHHREQGEKPYIILEGGSVPIGCFGYIAAIDEMLTTWNNATQTDQPDALFFTDGSGGTHAGIHLGYEAHGLETKRLWAVNICDSAEYFRGRVGKLMVETANQFGLRHQERDLQILDGHFGAGYGIASEEDLRFYAKVAREEGLLLDPSYTGKSFQGMLAEIEKSPDRFGSKILFLHSGGGFATFVHAEAYRQVLGATPTPVNHLVAYRNATTPSGGKVISAENSKP